jgi:hypothetical protein
VDRRRVGLWIDDLKARKNITDAEDTNLRIFTPVSDLTKVKFGKEKDCKLVLDMVDGYLSENAGLVKDFSRNIHRMGLWRFIKNPERFSITLRRFIKECDLVTVGSPEQASLVKIYNPNCFPIRDCHDEFAGPVAFSKLNKDDHYELFWEGLSVTLHHFRECLSGLKKFLKETSSGLHVVTNPEHKFLANSYFRVSSRTYVNKIFGEVADRVIVHDWSVQKVTEVSKFCDFGIIPILSKDSFAQFKPENKLLIYWRLGLPTLFSGTPAYRRVSKQFKLEAFEVHSSEWFEKLVWCGRDLESHCNSHRPCTSNLQETHSRTAIIREWERALKTIRVT